MKNKIIIIGGDPNSINSEIIFKTWKRLNKITKKKQYLIASHSLLYKQFKKINLKINIQKVNDLDIELPSNILKVLDVPLNFTNPFKVSTNAASTYVLDCLNLAHKIASYKKVKGIINCPINKNLIKTSKNVGVTEFFANKCKINDGSEIMLIHNKRLSVAPITTHIQIKKISNKIKSQLIINKILSLNKNYKKLFKIKPNIGILGLNPHNAELMKKSEEVITIMPAISKLKKRGIKISGPLVADTIFIENYKKYDVIVGMYHDQVLAPFKTLFHFDAINITLGLNYIRVSPDHGPAIELIGKNKASYISLSKCVSFINNL